MIRRRTRVLGVALGVGVLPALLAAGALVCGSTRADAAPAASWRLEQPTPPGSSWPVALGAIGDMEFWAPNRGLLITAGNPPTIPPGVWAYNGVEWHELASVCGATDGRIAWAGPEEFWTVSDGRPGQVAETGTVRLPPLADNTLCHFSAGTVAGSYAHQAFQPDSYQQMHGAACFGPADCWFGGDPLEEPQIGAFQLHWNGAALEPQPYASEGHAVEDMRLLEGHIYESVRLGAGDRSTTSLPEPPVVRRLNPEGVSPSVEAEGELPLYSARERPSSLDFLHLAAGGGVLWGAAGPQRLRREEPEEAEPPPVTVLRRQEGNWTQLFGPTSNPLGPTLLPEEGQLFPEGAEHATVSSLAVETDGETAWLVLRPKETPAGPSLATVLHISAAGQVLQALTLPSPQEQAEGIGRKGLASKLACPAPNDCWLATDQGWLFHLAPEGERRLPKDEDPAFAGPITYRPPDQGLPQVPADAPPADGSGLVEAPPGYGGAFAETAKPQIEATIRVPLLSHLRSRLLRGATLELSFHLAVKARIRLVAKRRRAVVAATPMRTLPAGNRRLLLTLDPRRWPTKLLLQTHALAPLPTETSRSSNVGTISTRFSTLPREALAGLSAAR